MIEINTDYKIEITFSNGKTYNVTADKTAAQDPDFVERSVMIICAQFAKENSLDALREELKKVLEAKFGATNPRPFLAAAKILLAIKESNN